MPGLPQGKPAGVRCPHLDDRLACRLFGHPDRPEVCRSLKPAPEMCGDSPAQAMAWLHALEDQTRPLAPP